MTPERLAEWRRMIPELRKAADWLRQGGALYSQPLYNLVLMLNDHMPDLLAEVERLYGAAGMTPQRLAEIRTLAAHDGYDNDYWEYHGKAIARELLAELVNRLGAN